MGATRKLEWGEPRLDGARILVVEDEFLIALELAAILSDAGATVVGPARTVPEALTLVADGELAGAVLDMRVASASVGPVARKLAEDNVPFVFYTGQSRGDPLQVEWPASPVVSKPAPPGTILKAVAQLLSTGEVERSS